MKNLLGEILLLSTEYLKKRGIENPRREATDLIVFALGLKNSIDLYLHFERPCTEEEKEKMRAVIMKRGNKMPFAYITGKVSFYGCTFEVNENVLIPRLETELFVDKIKEILLEEKNLDGSLWDLCTGSGCIGISLANFFKTLKVTLSDIDPKALAVAKGNADLNGTLVECLLGDLFSPFKGRKTNFLVCNPPYVAENVVLDDEVFLFEPKKALFAGEGGLDFYLRIAEQAPEFLEKGAKCFFEIGYDQEQALFKIFSAPYWKNKRCLKDLSSHPRFFLLEFE